MFPPTQSHMSTWPLGKRLIAKPPETSSCIAVLLFPGSLPLPISSSPPNPLAGPRQGSGAGHLFVLTFLSTAEPSPARLSLPSSPAHRGQGAACKNAGAEAKAGLGLLLFILVYLFNHICLFYFIFLPCSWMAHDKTFWHCI